MLKTISNHSFVVKAWSYVPDLINKSYCFRWVVGAGRFEEMYYYQHSQIYKIASRLGRAVMSPLVSLVSKVREVTIKSSAKNFTGILQADFVNRPLALLSIAGIALIITNTLARFLFFTSPSILGLLTRLGLIFILAGMSSSKISWQHLADHSWSYQTIKHIFVD